MVLSFQIASDPIDPECFGLPSPGSNASHRNYVVIFSSRDSDGHGSGEKANVPGTDATGEFYSTVTDFARFLG
jgi:hypothetical protein